jgi:hypothetical protein
MSEIHTTITQQDQNTKNLIKPNMWFYDLNRDKWRVMYQVDFDVWMCRDKKNTKSRRMAAAYIKNQQRLTRQPN